MELGNLYRLETISLAVNNFTEEIPSEIGALSRLKILSLGNNSFTGIIPDSVCNISTLERLDAQFNQLDGNIPAGIGYLKNLKVLSLYFNKLAGPIPISLFNISTLEIIDVRSNFLVGNISGELFRNLPKLRQLYLSSNKLSGQVLLGLHESSQLENLELSKNMFTGPIPHAIGNLTHLRTLKLRDDVLTGEIPPEIGNLSSMEWLDLSNATITGVIPSEIGKLKRLTNLILQLNSLSGSIHFSIFNLSSLQIIALGGNSFSGIFPSCEYYNLPNLQVLNIAVNRLSGSVLDCVSNSSNLQRIELSSNQLTGLIPVSLGNLRSLQYLNLRDNNLTADSTLSFLTSLTNCRSMRTLRLSYNPLHGSLPSTIGNLTSLVNLEMYGCRIFGIIPQEIGNLSSVIGLQFDHNDFTGSIPRTIKGLRSLNELFLNHNHLEGSTPLELCEMKILYLLVLEQNQLTGPVPQCLSNATSLQYLHLGSNMLSSNIWESLCTLRLRELNLNNNTFSGNIPQNIGNLDVAVTIDISMNQLSGIIPSALSNMQNLRKFSVFDNQLEGSLPQSLKHMVALEYVDMSLNNLVGTIPKSVEGLKYLKYFNVSFNRLTGEVPSGGHFSNFTFESFMSNEALCGAPFLQLPPCSSPRESHRRKVPFSVIIISPIIAIVFFLVSFMLIKICKTKKSQEEIPPALFEYRRLPYSELQVATNGLSESNLIATGGFGSVYQGKLFDGRIAAIKVFNLQHAGSFKSFDNECRILSNLRHRNLTKVISCCTNLDFRALVMEYMSNGSLDKWLYSHNNFLDISKRLDIMIDVAAAMEHLHHGNSTVIIHCDLKPSNILLDENMTGRVSDFGISKLFGIGEFIAQTKTIATIGYIAPEYGSKGLVSTSSDVYSFGILLMEVFSRKRPMDDMFEGDMSLKSWITQYCHNDISRVVDKNLIADDTKKLPGKLRCLMCIMELALKCSAELPEERINMIDTHVSLKKIRMEYHDHLC